MSFSTLLAVNVLYSGSGDGRVCHSCGNTKLGQVTAFNESEILVMWHRGISNRAVKISQTLNDITRYHFVCDSFSSTVDIVTQMCIDSKLMQKIRLPLVIVIHHCKCCLMMKVLFRYVSP